MPIIDGSILITREEFNRIDQKIDDIAGDVTDIKVSSAKMSTEIESFTKLMTNQDNILKDHETRHREIESWRANFAGKWMILGLIAAALLSALISLGFASIREANGVQKVSNQKGNHE